MRDEIPQLPDDARALLDAERPGVRPPDAMRAAVLARVKRTVAASSPPSGVPWRVFGAMAALAAAGFVASSVASRHPSPSPARHRHVAPSPTPPPQPRISAPTPVTAPTSPTAPTPPTAPTAPRPSEAPAAHETPRSVDDLAAQVALLDAARAAVARRDGAAAMAAVTRYRHMARRRLDEEIDVIEVRARVQRGQIEEARRAATRFHARHPASVFGPTVDESIRGAP